MVWSSMRVEVAGCFASLNMTMQADAKKNREGNRFSSRVEVRVVTPKKFGALTQRWA
jgi:hypothetical protein